MQFVIRNLNLSLALFALLFSAFFFVALSPALAEEDLLGVDYGAASGLGAEDPRAVIGSVIRVGLSLLGIGAIVTVLYAGFLWMTAGGNEEKATKAKKTLWAAIIGLLIILSAYSIQNFVFKNLYQATTGRQYNYP